MLTILLALTMAVAQDPVHTAIAPAPRTDQRWIDRNEKLNQLEKGASEVFFLGDSITEGWETTGKEIWDDQIARFKAINLGISGDRTQHVLWRIKNGNLNGANSAKLVVIMIGTNNSNGNDHTAEQIADGVKAIIKEVRQRLPKAKVLALAIFPRGKEPNPQRAKIQTANELIAKAADNKWVFYRDIGSHFMDMEGAISAQVMPDFLHLSEEGYRIWATHLAPIMRELLALPNPDSL